VAHYLLLLVRVGLKLVLVTRIQQIEIKYMRHSILKVLAVAVGAGLITVAQVHASPLIIGTIDFQGSFLTTPFTMNNTGSTLANATAFTSINAFVSAATGDYNSPTGLVNTTGYGAFTGGVDFTAFTFVPPEAPPALPLWTFTDYGITYSFTTDSLLSSFSAGSDEWTFSGTGYASITGFANTEGTWILSAGKTSSDGGTVVSLVFDSASVAAGTPIPYPPVPDGGLTVSLLGGALVALGGLRRSKLGC